MKASDRTYPLEIKAQVIAAILAGGGVSDTAKRFGILKQTASRWAKEARTPPEKAPLLDPDVLGARILALIDCHIETIMRQLEATDAAWVRRQNGVELASLLREEHSGLLRLLSGLRPASEGVPTIEGAVAELGAGEGSD
jgi:transposase-like protein